MKKKSFRGTFNDLLGSDENVEQKRETKNVIEKKYTLVANVEHMDKVKAISYMERKMIKDIFAEALSSYIENYEKKNGEVILPKV
jgi:hypothetical protein